MRPGSIELRSFDTIYNLNVVDDIYEATEEEFTDTELSLDYQD